LAVYLYQRPPSVGPQQQQSFANVFRGTAYNPKPIGTASTALTPMLAHELQTTATFASRSIEQALHLNMFAPQLRVHAPAVKAVFDSLRDTNQIPEHAAFRLETFLTPIPLR
jgi:hypothetical protein